VSVPVLLLSVRALLVQRRTIALALIAAGPVVVALAYALAAPADDPHREFLSRLVQQIFVPTVAAVVALVVGVSAIGDEREDGTILYLVATPLSRLSIVATKVASAWAVAMVLLLPSLVACALLVVGRGDGLSLLAWPLAGVALASLAYCAAAASLSLSARRPIIIGVIYILLWEGSVATFAPSAAKLSISAYGRALVAERLPEASAPVVGPAAAAAVLLVVVAAATWYGAWRMRRVELP
jgi:ABC-2 type transport system permease protein